MQIAQASEANRMSTEQTQVTEAKQICQEMQIAEPSQVAEWMNEWTLPTPLSFDDDNEIRQVGFELVGSSFEDKDTFSKPEYFQIS